MTVGIDAPGVADATEAELLCVHHLKLAATYFEATDFNLGERLPADQFSYPAMQAWVAQMEALYPEED